MFKRIKFLTLEMSASTLGVSRFEIGWQGWLVELNCSQFGLAMLGDKDK